MGSHLAGVERDAEGGWATIHRSCAAFLWPALHAPNLLGLWTFQEPWAETPCQRERKEGKRIGWRCVWLRNVWVRIIYARVSPPPSRSRRQNRETGWSSLMPHDAKRSC